MARTIPTTEPVTLTSGDSWEWDVTRLAVDYPASSWTLAYRLNGPSPRTITATADGDTFCVRAPAATTRNMTGGVYELVGYVTDGTDRFTVYESTVLVAEDPARKAAFTSHAEKTLAILEAAIEGRLTADIESYQVEGRAVNKIPVAELRRLRGFYAAAVWRERNPGRLSRNVEVRFG